MGATQRDGRENLTFGSDSQKAVDKLRELIIYIADKCEYDQSFGSVKLNKILFFADFISFAKYGVPITGVQYKKYRHGPVPTILKRLRDEMEAGRAIALKTKQHYGHIQHRVVS